MYSNVTFNFKGKRALVTGAAQGIGRGIAVALAEAGAETYALDKNKEGLDRLASEHASIHPVVVDLRDWEATRKAVEGITSLDFVVNDAAILIVEKFLDVTKDALEQTLTINTKAPLNICQVVANDMIARKRPGAIVNISSQGSKVPIRNDTTYNVSKAALDMITKSMAAEMGQHQIRVNSVLPTLVMTEMGRAVWDNEEASKQLLARLPLGRFAEVPDIVGPVLFLLSDCASMIHGHQLLADGGFCVS